MLSIEDHKNNNFSVDRTTHTAVDNNLTALGFAGSERIVILATPIQIDVVSENANDTEAGTGARTVVITGGSRIDDGSVRYITERITLNGTVKVRTLHQYTDVYNVEVEEYGSVGCNVGAINISETTGDVVIFTLTTTQGVKKNSLFTAPNEMKIKQLNVFINSVDGDKIDFTSVFYDIIIKKFPALKAGRFETVSLNPSTGVLNPGTMLSRYICSGGKTEIELFDTVNPSDRLWILAKNLTNTDSYTITTELILYDV